MPDIQGSSAVSVLSEDGRKVAEALARARTFIDRDYMMGLDRMPVERLPETGSAKIRMVRLKKIIYNADDVRARLMSVYHTLSGISDLVFLLICGSGSSVRIYMGIRAEENASLVESSMTSSLLGNFPGTEFDTLDAMECGAALRMISEQGGMPVTAAVSVSQVPSFREDVPGSQGLEHFIDAMKGKTYTAMIVAAPLSVADAVDRRGAYEDLYSSLSALEKLVYQYTENISISEQHSLTETITKSITDSLSRGYSYSESQNTGKNFGGGPNVHLHGSKLGLGGGVQMGRFSSTGAQQGQSQSQSRATQSGTSTATGRMDGMTHGSGQTLSLTQTNKTVSCLLERIEEQIRRIRECEAFGLWESCAFFLSPAPDVALVAANIYRSLTCGERSGAEKSWVNSWLRTGQDSFRNLLHALSQARMPLFRLPSGTLTSAGTMVSGAELSLLMGFPMDSVSGMTVQRMAAFGREVYVTDAHRKMKRGVTIGKIYHMGSVENENVTLNIDDFSAHVLVTGTTGVGKSTFMAMLLSSLYDVGVKLMVIEPVKGEYRDLIGNIPGLQVFTTNPRKNRMLRINPFEFNDEIHVLTHIDRLIEVFSVCWPLYAAQPAMLRECVEEAYMRSGWDLSNSVYIGKGRKRYPDFRLLLEIVPKVIERSHFVGETKGTYEGALLTRIAMLSHGIYGQVFNGSACLKDEELFEKNTVIDLSDVGSQETISLLMGILVVRLREYRIGQSRPANQDLRHVMVLEEAHNIFRRNTQSNVEGGETISGKSVQMLAQCIAEMRGYGQGIFIVDQSPGEIDISGIRNTATKVIMRQPEASDQKTVAESLSLNEEQMKEISRLPERVAVVYQSGWAEPVLMKINESKEKYKTINTDETTYENLKKVRGYFVLHLMGMCRRKVYDLDELRRANAGIRGFSEAKKQDFMALFEAYDREYVSKGRGWNADISCREFYCRLCTEVLTCDDFYRLSTRSASRTPGQNESREEAFRLNCLAWRDRALEMLDQYVLGLSQEKKDELLGLLLSEPSNRQKMDVYRVLYGAGIGRP